MEVRNLMEKENGSVSFEMWVGGEEWRAYRSKVSQKLQKQKPVPGHRAGKALLGVAEKFYGKELFDKAAVEAGSGLFGKACAEHDLAPVSQPQIMTVSADADTCMLLCRFANYPRVTELQYKGLKPVKPVKTVSEADVDDAIGQYMRQHLYVHEVPREARMNDIVQVDFTGTSGGEGFPYDHSSKSRFVMGSGQLFAGLDEALLGHFAGDELELSLTMPEDFHRKDVAGLTLDLKVHLQGVWARDLLECTDEYVKEHVKGCETLQEFREQTREQIQKRYDAESSRQFEYNLSSALAGAVTCPIPGAMVETALGQYLALLRGLAVQKQKTVEGLLKEEGKTLQDFLEQSRPSAEQKVRLSIALDYVARAEGLQVTREELDQRIGNYARQAKIGVEEAKRRLGGEDKLVEQMLSDRAMKLVRDSAEPQIREVDQFGEL